jgi:septal ring factor EnvC (AmiA/AmiB activator)
MSTVPATPSFGDSGSVQTTVEKEMRRRKMLIGLFLGLLLIPVAVAAVFLFSAPRAIAPAAVNTSASSSPEMQQQVSANATKLAEQQKQLTQLNETVARRIPSGSSETVSANTSVQQQIEVLRAQVTVLGARVQQVQQQNEQLQKQVTALGGRHLEVQPSRPQ